MLGFLAALGSRIPVVAQLLLQIKDHFTVHCRLQREGAVSFLGGQLKQCPVAAIEFCGGRFIARRVPHSSILDITPKVACGGWRLRYEGTASLDRAGDGRRTLQKACVMSS